MNLGDCKLCGHPRRDHENFERCTRTGCDCVRPTITVKATELAQMPADAVRALHDVAELAVARERFRDLRKRLLHEALAGPLGSREREELRQILEELERRP